MKLEIQRCLINITGIVQGVGFRPFVYRKALSYKIFGWVRNDSNGIEIDVEGNKYNVTAFIESLSKDTPPHAYIKEISCKNLDPVGYSDFKIIESLSNNTTETYVSPDISICNDCLNELYDFKDIRNRYPFINCTNCGPRFTITYKTPYDRINTTMRKFKMCSKCEAEYNDPCSRRFHAEPISCHKCGPVVYLLDHTGTKLKCLNAISETISLLKQGKIIAIKGLGGFHLACNAFNFTSVLSLRKRKNRDFKPFALMVKGIDSAEKHCYIFDKEKEILLSSKKPIVLLKKRADSKIRLPANDIAPDSKYLGIMLPYTPLHHLLFDSDIDTLIMTSGNKFKEPICFKDDEAISKLFGIADYFLMHDREIHIRTDDSIAWVIDGKESIIRRSRGYVPFPIKIPIKDCKDTDRQRLNGILACGGELKNTFCLIKNGQAFLSHHIGDLENIEILKSFEDGISHFLKVFDSKINTVVYDLHPEYLSAKFALDYPVNHRIEVQHHHAHIASCMAENGLVDPVIGIAFDGSGFGTDGRIWGGEFFVGDYLGFERVAHLENVKMPGGDACIKHPWRMAVSHLVKIFGEDWDKANFKFLDKINDFELNILIQQINKNINSYETSSMGRLFDAVSALSGLCNSIEFEGQAAIKLENIAIMNDIKSYSFGLDFSETKSRPMIIKTDNLIKTIINDIFNGKKPDEISGCFHKTIAKMCEKVCGLVRKKRDIKKVILSGGVFQNKTLLNEVISLLKANEFEVFIHHLVPTNDGGISLGQAAIATWKLWGKIKYEKNYI